MTAIRVTSGERLPVLAELPFVYTLNYDGNGIREMLISPPPEDFGRSNCCNI